MNLQNIRDSIICDNFVKCKTYKEKIRSCIFEYFESNDASCIKTLTAQLEIVGILLTSNDKIIQNELTSLKNKIYEKIKEVTINFCSKMTNNKEVESFESYLHKLENNKKKLDDESVSDTFSEESECAFTWKDNKNQNTADCKPKNRVNLPSNTVIQHSPRLNNRFTQIHLPTSNIRNQSSSQVLSLSNIYFTEVLDNVEIVRRGRRPLQNNNTSQNRGQNNTIEQQGNNSNQNVVTDAFIDALNEAFSETARSEARILALNQNITQNNANSNADQESTTPLNITETIYSINHGTNDAENYEEITFTDVAETQDNIVNTRDVYMTEERSVGYYTDIPNLVAPDQEPRATRDDQTNRILRNLRENRGITMEQVTQRDIEEIFNVDNNENDSTEVQMDMNEVLVEYGSEVNVNLLPSRFVQSNTIQNSLFDTASTNSENHNKYTFEQNYSTETESITKLNIRNNKEDQTNVLFGQTLIKLLQSIKFITNSCCMFDLGFSCFLIWLLKENFFDQLTFYHQNNSVEIINKILCNFSKTPQNRAHIRSYDVLKDMPMNAATFEIYRLFLDKNSVQYKSLDDFLKEYDNCENTKDKMKILDCAVKWIFSAKNRKNESLNNIVMQKINENLFVSQEKSTFLIGKLIYKSITLQKYCLKTGITNQIISIFEELYWKKTDLISVIFCLSNLIDRCEENRRVFLERKVFHKVFDYFKSLIKEESFENSFAICLYFLKNMTRSIKFVRADLPEFPILELLLFCLKKVIKTRNTKDVCILNLIEMKNESILKQKQNCAYYITKEILAILSNLILEYGNYKEKFTQKDGLNLIKKVCKKKNLEYNVTFTLKNFVYECSINHKDYFFSVFAPKVIDNFSTNVNNNQFCVTPNNKKDYEAKKIKDCISNNIFYYQSKTQKHFFNKLLKKYKKADLETRKKASIKACKVLKELLNLIRNILCCNMQENMYFTATYDDLIENVILMMYKLNKGVMYKEKNEVIKQMIYIFVNLTASRTKYKDLFMDDVILSQIKILTTNPNKKITVGLIWLVINLTWNDDVNYKNRIVKLTEFGFKKWLNDIKGTNTFINDKVITALENME